MGKTGAGKSLLCNALFQQQICLISDLMACIREPQRLVLTCWLICPYGSGSGAG
ncbi:TPA: hypothetical protein ACN7M6_004759 [Klebsiella michiganensis]|uniref:hypothetical protein n=1 Tax=Klebsiella michiganensis TaxID=1134687 RepID=UPI00370F66B1